MYQVYWSRHRSSIFSMPHPGNLPPLRRVLFLTFATFFNPPPCRKATQRGNLESLSHRCYLREAAFESKLSK